MTSSGVAVHPSAREARSFVTHWLGRLAAAAPADELIAAFANGVRLETPTGIVRGPDEFREWYRAGRHRPLVDPRDLAGPRAAGGSWEVEIRSPVHRRLTLALPAADGGPAVHQEWWVVRRDGALRIRTVVVTGPAARPVPVPAAAAEPAYV
ncbi:hypothetical protein [Streptomyces uncialis]|uniref:hypothetical protein n=1 Tax=Streptomyces uncialis TaxID=1048205 RepID=UPI0033D74838